MSQYIVSARKYRPDSFETLVGQDNIARTLKNSILRGQLAHAYLFCGPRGVGKTSTARIFAKAINCSNPSADMDPCGECESCRSFVEGRSYCIHELDAASNNGVEDIKALMDKVQIPPQVGKYSVYIIDEVHMLSTSAFNAFLKTLEEPPAHAIFILATTEKHKILPTILSRCQTYDFNRISVSDMVSNLRTIAQRESVSIDDESLHVIAAKADGAMRDALTIFDQTVAFCGTDIHYEDVIRNLNVLDNEYSFRLVEDFLAGNYADAFMTFDEILAKGFNAQYFLSALGSHMRDLLVSRTDGLESLLDLPDSLRTRYREQASRCSIQFLYDALAVIAQCESGYKASTNQRLHIEFALMRLSFLHGVPASKVEATKPQPVAVAQPATAPKPAPAPAPKPETVAAPEPAPEPKPEPKPEPAPAPEPVSLEEPELVVEPALEPAPVPTPEPVKPRSRRKVAAGLSLTSIIEEDRAAQLKPVQTEAEEKIPEDDLIREKWQELAAMNTKRPRLASALANSSLDIVEENGLKLVTFHVVNEAQKKWIEDGFLHTLEGNLRKLVASSLLRLAVSVLPDAEQVQKIYLPEDKARDLMSKNEEVRNFITEFELDVK